MWRQVLKLPEFGLIAGGRLKPFAIRAGEQFRTGFR
jgi:hypothetical protein